MKTAPKKILKEMFPFGLLLTVCLLIVHAKCACRLEAPEYKVSYADKQTYITCMLTCNSENVSRHSFLTWETNLDETTVVQERNETAIRSTLQLTPHLQHGMGRLILKLHCIAYSYNSKSLQSVITTILLACHSGQLLCDLHYRSSTELYSVSCGYNMSQCGPTLRCEVRGKLLANSQAIDPNTGEEVRYMYSDVDLKGDPVKCYLYHTNMDEANRIYIILKPDVNNKTTQKPVFILKPDVNNKTTPKPVFTSPLLTTPHPSNKIESEEWDTSLSTVIVILLIVIVVGVVLLFICLKTNARFQTLFIKFLGSQNTSPHTGKVDSGPLEQATQFQSRPL